MVGLLFVADFLWVAVGLFSALPRAAEDLEQAEGALATTDLEGLRFELEEALAASSSASSLMRHPSFRILAEIPGLRADGAALRSLGSAGEALAHAGLAAADAGDAVGVSSSRSLTSSLYRDGRVDLEAVAAAEPYLQEADRRVAAAGGLLTSAPDPVLEPLREALVRARSGTVAAGTATRRASTLLESLPSLMGGDGPRRYLLAFQALGEARATGGVMVHYGIVDARNGALTLHKVGPLESGFPTVDGDIEPILAPRWFERSYGSQLALRQAQQTNTSPNFPVVAEIWLRMYEKTHSSRLDGVLAMDPVALQHLLGGTGPINGGRGPALNSENAARVLLHDSYLLFGETAQDLYVTSLIKAFWKQLNQGDVDSPALLSGIAQAATTEHLKAYMRAPHDQQAMKELSLDGAPASSGDNVQLVFHNNYGLNKVDYYMRRRIETNVALDYDGSARVSTTAIITNTAPSSGPLSDLLGKTAGRQGVNRMLLAFLLPRQSTIQELVEVRPDSQPKSSAPFVYEDEGLPVAWKVLDLRPGATVRLTLDYEIPDAIDLARDGDFQLSLLPQPTAVPDSFALTISPPVGLRIQDVGLAGSEPAKSLSFSGTLDRKRVIHTRLLRAEE